MTTTYSERIAAQQAVFDEALAEYATEIGKHGHDYDAWVAGATPKCKCGVEFRTRRSVGMHASAAERRASKAYDAKVRDAIEAVR